MSSRIKAVGFDIDGTLYLRTPQIDERIQIEFAEKLFELKPELGNITRALEFFREEYRGGIKSGGTILREAGCVDPYKVKDECLATANVLDLIGPDSRLVTLIDDLRQKYSLFVVTSNPRELAVSKLHRLGIDEHIFDFLICSDFGEKRNGDAFREALKFSNESPGEHLYVGDSIKADIIPARSVGMSTVLIDPSAQTNSLKRVKEIYSIRGLLK